MLPGQKFEFDSKVYQVRDMLDAGKVLAENHSFGGTEVFYIDEVVKNFFLGAIRFEVYGKNTKVATKDKLATEYKYGDFNHIDEKKRQAAWERYQILKPLIGITRTTEDILTRIEEVVAGKVEGLSIYKNRKLSKETIWRWLRDYERGGQDIRTLVPAHDEKGARGISRSLEIVDEVIAKAIASHYLTPERGTIQCVHDEVVYQINKLNTFRDEHEKIKEPHYGTVRNKIHRLSPRMVTEARYGKKEADKQFKGVQTGCEIKATRPLEVTYIDHTKLDLFLVDENDRMPIGRPNLTFMIDLATRYPLGFYVSYTPPSYHTASECLYHAIISKHYVEQSYPDINEQWLAWGLPEVLYVDNGKEFIGKSMEHACDQLGIGLENGRPGKGEDKAIIERFFGSLNTRLLHRLPGTSFSNVIDKKDYDPKKNAVISLQAFEKILHISVLKILANTNRNELGGAIPKELWEKGCKDTPPILPHSREELKPLLGAVEERTIQKSGIQFYNLFYNSAKLAELRARLPRKQSRITMKYDPGDISIISVWDEKKQKYFEVLNNNQEYTRNLSLWKHRIILRYVKENMKEVKMMHLLEGKKLIEEIVDKEWANTKGTKGRQRLARFKGIGDRPEDNLYKICRNSEIDLPLEMAQSSDRLISDALKNEPDQETQSVSYSCETDDGEIAASLGMKEVDSTKKNTNKTGGKVKKEKKVVEEAVATPNFDGWS